MIPIFEGKHASYNKAILEALLTEGAMTSWQLAKRITPQIRTVKRTSASTKTQKVYSVLIRKNGRLDDLKTKEYIRLNDENQKWEIAAKGMIAICIEKPNLKPLINPEYWNKYVVGDFQIPKETVKLPFYGITINGKQFEKDLSKLLKQLRATAGNVSIVNKIVEDAKKIIDEGINFDRISTSSLMILLLKKAMVNHNLGPIF